MPERLPTSVLERFERLAWPFLPVVLRTARYLTQHDQQAEDLAQETMLKALRRIESYRDGTDMKAWLMTILRNTFIDSVRAQGRQVPAVSLDETGLDESAPSTESAVDVDVANPSALLERFEDRQVIEALKTLPEEIRWTLLLVDVEQMDQSAAAEILQVPMGTVKSRAFRGRRMLRDRLLDLARSRGYLPGQAAPGEKRHG